MVGILFLDITAIDMTSETNQTTQTAQNKEGRKRSAVLTDGLHYQYPSSPSWILQDINLEIEPGEFILLVGPSGCGKSTLSLTLNGIIPRDFSGRKEGHVEVHGWNPESREVYEMATKIGLVFQDADSQIANMFIGDEIAFGAQNLRVPKEEILQRMERVLEAIGMEDMEDRSVYDLSGGQKQRVAIGSVLAMEPLVMVFDEPTANLDPQGSQEVHKLIYELNQEHGVTVIVIEHDVSHFAEVADRLVVMEKGEILFDGPPREVYAEQADYLHQELGLWIPGACEFAVKARDKGYQFSNFPLSMDEVPVEDLAFALPDSSASANDQVGTNPIISIRGVHFSYGDGPQILKDINLDIHENNIVAVVGQNGSGKTTLVSQLIGIHRPDRGSITVAGLDATTASIRDLSQKIGYVFQYPEHQFVTDTVFDEIAFSLRNQEMAEVEIKEQVGEMLQIFGLEGFEDRHPYALSRGQKRRLSVASMLVLRPEVFILDEPTTGQDWINVVNLMEIITGLHAEGLTFIMATHSMRMVAQYADRVVVMRDGRVVHDGTPSSLFTDRALTESLSLEVPPLYQLLNRIREHQPEFPAVRNLGDLSELLKEK